MVVVDRIFHSWPCDHDGRDVSSVYAMISFHSSHLPKCAVPDTFLSERRVRLHAALLSRFGGTTMKWMYDIYQKLPTGGRLWIESAATLETAKERLGSLCAIHPATYLIYHFSSGKLVEPIA